MRPLRCEDIIINTNIILECVMRNNVFTINITMLQYKLQYIMLYYKYTMLHVVQSCAGRA